MAASLEARVPLTDHRIVEFAASIPGTIRMHNGQLKWLLRRALRRRLPDELLDRSKQGFGPPLNAWMRGPLGAAARQLLTRSDGRIRQLLSPIWVDRYLERDRSGTAARGRAWNLLILELWLRTIGEGQTLSGVGVAELAQGEAA